MTIIDLLGLLGVVIIIIAYVLIQTEKLATTKPIYSILNILGASLILFSLLFDWNLSAVLIEVFWILISIYGLARVLNKQKTS